MNIRTTILLWILFRSSSLSAQVLGSEDRTIYDIAVKDSLLAAATDAGIEIWNVSTSQLLSSIPNPGNVPFTTICFGRSADEVFTGDRSGQVSQWDFRERKKVGDLSARKGAVTSIAFEPAQALLVAGTSAGNMVIIETPGMSQVFEMDWPDREVTAVKFSRDGTQVFAASTGGWVDVYSVPGYTVTRKLRVPGWISAIEESDSTGTLAIASGREVYYYGSRTGQLVNRVKVGAAVSSLACHPDNSLAASTLDNSALIINRFGDYQRDMGTLVTQVLFVNLHEKFFTLAVATKGNGLVIVDGRKMKLKHR